MPEKIYTIGWWLWCWTETEFTDTGLLPFTWYEYRVSSDNGLGKTRSSAVVYRTDSAVPSGNFTFTVGEVNATSMSLSWTAPTSPNGLITHYVVRAVSSDGRSTSVVSRSDGDDGLLVEVVEGLTPYSRYTVTVSACNVAGCLNATNHTTIITLQATPSGQSPPVIVIQGPTQLNVTWIPPSQPNGRLYSHEYLLLNHCCGVVVKSLVKYADFGNSFGRVNMM